MPERVLDKTEESKGLCPTIQKDEKSTLFCNSVNSIISSSKFSFKEKNILRFFEQNVYAKGHGLEAI